MFNHICSCNNETSVSLFVEGSCCNNESAPTSCNAQAGACDTEECACETEVEILATDKAIASEIKTNAIARIILHAIINSTIYFELPNKFETYPSQCFNKKDPPNAGKFLHILYQSLKIPFPIS